MHKIRTAVALTAALALAGCQTMNGVTVNGVEIEDGRVNNAQLGNVCGTNMIVCVIGAVLVIGGGIWLLTGSDDDDDIPG